eukprot:TRINITY_DN33587_c0_g1_i1.p1 TRINITY_DN33587_c0_g1~~TRINITY_DN33587_c0_g1_i1.p1  ORF type:complete len:270 (+),score=47.24 TRINITY_DN33587_c0_g1_i1:88-897(+)
MVATKRTAEDSEAVDTAPKRARGDELPVPSLDEYTRRLTSQGKFQDKKPGTNSLDGCLHSPPRLPPVVSVLEKRNLRPERGEDGCFVFDDYPVFKPNLSPKDVIQLGSFGGTYFRDIYSAVTGERYQGLEVIKELPKDWFKGVDVDTMVCSSAYAKKLNKYGVSCGGSLGQWETSGWISASDPYGWFQWYCHFFLGRRSTDDERQISRWQKGQGPTGRWRIRLCNDIIKARAAYDDVRVSPVLRQVLQHWAYKLEPADLEEHRRKKFGM